MAEEHGFQAPEGHILCANNCGFFGSPATMNLCSKCFRDLQLKEERENMAKTALSPSPSPVEARSSRPAGEPVDLAKAAVAEPARPRPEPSPSAARPNRCLTCRKRVGLTGFKCRCGSTYCGSHRYPEQHRCPFDYKALGKEEIAKANPVIKAEKLQKI